MVFAVSTFLYRHKRLTRDQLMEIAAHGFTFVELFASRLHVDYHNATVVADVQQWLAEARLELTSVHAPVLEMSLASAEAAEREAAVAETERDKIWRWGDVAEWAAVMQRKTKVPRKRRGAKTTAAKVIPGSNSYAKTA